MLERRQIFFSTTITLFIFVSSMARGETCLAPERPFVPSDRHAAREYADLIRKDFENYISDMQNYFQCMEGERSRAFPEAQEVSQKYGQFIQFVQE
ncbi:hypothetical protein SAMN04488490_1319 [Marinobacter sp. LV10R510-11A]|uniref:hypothetical protein n=1 Tax=Marinobacter sp. LV10R510-11A TaxID=1415568 RepID=UPI000BC09ADA|nr:hypothetical protein [Marinobacter sp. LV10R510-11A]SOB75689.1 hypothetical protein SAMN04488490_1319 [Marinobacter sp. LV10R510-11A]